MTVLSGAVALLLAAAGCAGPSAAAPQREPSRSPGPESHAAAPPAPSPPAPPVAGGPLHPVALASPGIRTVTRATLAAVGDVLMHGAVKDSAADHRVAPRGGAPGNDAGYGWLWAPVSDLLGAADLAFANLETPVAPVAGKGSRSFVFNAPPAAVLALRHAGVRVVSVANNHIFDQGRAGFEETLRQLDEASMAYVGAGEAGREAGPRLLEVNGIRIALLAYAHFFNQTGNECPPAAGRGGKPCLRASLLDPDRAVADVAAAAKEADAVIVSVHWGDEYHQQPREADVALAHRLADAGALVVLGHHPHVLQPVELYPRADGATALIAYSLGNFVSNQSRNYVQGVTPEQVAATRDGVILRAELVRRDYGRGVSRVELGAAGWWPLWTENDTVDPDRRAKGTARPSIQVVSVDRALGAVRAELAALPDPVPPTEQARYVRLRQREQLYVARRAAIAAVLGEDLATEAPPAAAPSATAAPAP
jgi:poly-gamma-glutamate synthesis protein (capsule biosynthesis protein)